MSIEHYFGKDYPVGIDGVAAERLQSFTFSRNQPSTPEYQLGTEPAIGLSQGNEEFTGNLTWFPINANIEQLLTGESGSRIGLKDFVDASGVSVVGPKGGLQAAQITALTYRVRVNENFTATATLSGSGWGSSHAYVVPTPSGTAVFQAKSVAVTVGGVATARAQGVDLRANIESARMYQLGSANPTETKRHRPTLELNVDWAESDNIAGNVELTDTVPGDIRIVVNSGSGALTIDCLNMVRATEDAAANVTGMATRGIRYQTKGQEVTYNNLIIMET